MENQHRKITGYRELGQAEIDLMNEIKAKGVELGELIKKLEDNQVRITAEHGTGDAEPYRWIAIGKTSLQQGLMALTRAVAKPEAF
jgi:predicted AAA+ superfamily ATPase